MSRGIVSVFDSVRRFMWRYHLTMFIAIAAGGIAIAIFSLLGVIEKSSDTANFDVAGNTSFDQGTIDRVRQLQDTPTYQFNLPTNQRNNPFVE